MQNFNTALPRKRFLKQYIARYGVPRKIGTKPGTVFVKEAFAQFCRLFGIEQNRNTTRAKGEQEERQVAV